MPQKKSADLSIQKPLAPVILLFGTQDYLIQLMKKNIIHEALPEDDLDFNLSRYDMFDVPLEQALEDAETVPFMGEKKVVVIENPFFLTAEKVKAKIEQHLPALERYLEHPSPDSILIISAPYEKLDRRKKAVKSLEKAAKMYELSQLTDSTLYRLMENVAGRFGAVYTRSGHDQLIASSGQDLARLAHEVEKCALYCGTDRPIDGEAVLEIGSRSLETNVFLLVDKVMKRRTAEALHLLHELVRMKEEPLKLLALLERQFRIVYQVSYYHNAGYTQNSIAGKIGIHPYVVKLAAEQAKLYKPEYLRGVLVRCTEADYRIKTGAGDKLLILELLIHKISA
ncbi:DNA polymerase III subunit delta [Sporolactobacillus shoreae]|uniref:DNA polymerase III subunit delta n=1 Tax=Sporolactobacillus shoreae TaxID=1465501 RepID=A0A4Z0GQN9_9BACL|nr:DNA polymerase III subunit delta [Sporolactobacillus shoreae]TGA99563.1 DNA polymerase III subunit delta [Sporolactobacillus shoreae]